MKYKVGDKVKITDKYSNSKAVNCIGTVKMVFVNSPIPYKVDLLYENSPRCWSFKDNELELV